MTTPLYYTILAAAVANGVGKAIYCDAFKSIVLSLNTLSSADMTIKFQISYQETVPNFAVAQSPTNQWDYVEVIDLEDGSAIDGDTGIALAGTDDNRNFELNINGATWVSAIISSWVAGSATLGARLTNNEVRS